ncbi:MAG: transcriptional regulator [Candidatus Omnitrophica bacterium]|nr:transcriptional regulator [Candidatus Omnitrophota bacterium]
MEIPLLDLRAQYMSIKAEIDEAVKRVIDSQYFILSPEVSSFEKETASYCGVEHAAGVASGTDAIVLSLKAAGVGKGDLVITTPFTFFATAESISVLGARPVFADIREDTYNIDPAKIEEAIEGMGPADRERLKAIVPVHLYGQCADMSGIMRIAEKHSLSVVEDCAQAIGATHNGRKAGSFGIAGCLSFFPSKNLGGFGDGGMVVSGNKALIEKVKKLRVHGSGKQYVHEEVGFNSRLDSFQAAVLRVKLKELDKWIEGRRRIAGIYNDAFRDIPVKTPLVAEGNDHTYHQYTIETGDRDGLGDFLSGKGIAARVYYPVPLHLQPCYKDLGYPAGSFPVSEKKAGTVISLPVYPELSQSKVDYVAGAVKEFFEG